MLDIIGLCSGYPGKPVLQDCALTAFPGQITAILGPNGCGKSTLLKSLCGILKPSGGQILLDGQDLRGLVSGALARTMAYLPQSRQIPDITVERLVLHGRFPYLRYPRKYGKKDHTAAEAAMEQMGILELASEPLSRLSGGQRQKVYLAMTLAQDTPVLLLDEPTTYLDISQQLQLLQLAKQLAAAGKYVLMVVHDLSHGLEQADRIVLLQDGRTMIQGTPDAVFASGVLDLVFGVQVCRVETASGWHYYCQPKSIKSSGSGEA